MPFVLWTSAVRTAGLLALAGWLAVAPAAGAAGLTIGTGNTAGVYHPVGVAVADLLRAEIAGLDVAVESTGGSMENLSRVEAGELSMGIARSDLLNDALLGFGAFDGGEPLADLRVLFVLHAEPLVVVARADAGISTVGDLAGKRINLGPAGSASRTMLELLFEAWEWSEESFPAVEQIPPAEQVAALCDGKVAAVAFVAATPTSTVADALKACETILVPVSGEPLPKLLDAYPFLVASTIPAGAYREGDDAVSTVGPMAVMVASAAMPDDTAYRLTRAVVRTLDRLAGAHPALARLGPQALMREDLGAPVHPGALRYYREAGVGGASGGPGE